VESLKKFVWAALAGVAVNLYRTFVIQTLWNWFVVPTFKIGEISFLPMFGLVLLISIMRGWATDSPNELEWKMATHMLNACVPIEKREELAATLEREQKTIWNDLGTKSLGEVLGVTVGLVIGWVVHIVSLN
jgi:hypothetical protein